MIDMVAGLIACVINFFVIDSEWSTGLKSPSVRICSLYKLGNFAC